MLPSLQPRIEALGRTIFNIPKKSAFDIFKKDSFYRQVLDWSMGHEALKTQLFRFVDVLPCLKDSESIVQHLQDYLADSQGEIPSFLSAGLKVSSFVPSLTAGIIKKNVNQMAQLFITGETIDEVVTILKKNRLENKTFTLDILGEATLTEAEAQQYQAAYLNLIEYVGASARDWPTNDLLNSNHRGAIPRANISIKLSSLYSQINEKAWDNTKKILKDRLRPILKRAQHLGVFINFDMEQYALKNLTLEVFSELVLEDDFRHYPHVGVVIQAYLRESLMDLHTMIHLAHTRGTPFTVRLVKGAYWDYETIHAVSLGWPCPVYACKNETDANYEACSQLLLNNTDVIDAALASHNVRSLAAALAYAESLKLPKNSFEIQMLYGMADSFKDNLTAMGYRLREYTTMGSLIPGMGYLVRRLLENTSNESFLRHALNEGQTLEQLLQDPRDKASKPLKEPVLEFKNEPLTNFTKPESRHALNTALDTFVHGLHYPLIIGGQKITEALTFESLNPSNPSKVVGVVASADTNQANAAVQAASQAFQNWSNRPIEERACYLDALAGRMQERRFDLIATQIYEVGKPWSEADGDVAEAIDFCRYYAQEMRRLGEPIQTTRIPGERSYYHYQPRGVALVIAPWNFPLAILTGMTVAALVTGNTVIMKPSEQSSITAYGLMELLESIGLPAGVVNFLPCEGATVGDYLVRHPGISTIAFTGSRAVGLRINEAASKVMTGQRHIKRCILELGGKNAMIIDSDADLDEAVAAATYSALGYAGQKCSALSRVIVLADVYDAFIDRIVESFKSLAVLPAQDPRAYLGPVVSLRAQQRLLKVIEAAESTSRLVFKGSVPSTGYFVPPTIFTDVLPSSILAQEELFGPVLAVIKAHSIEEAIAIANNSDYALTGGAFSRNPQHLKQIEAMMEVGNLYLNRSITGALVKRHPFGGFKLSGAGTKAGGPDYLLHFMDPRTVTENTVRRGFAAEKSNF